MAKRNWAVVFRSTRMADVSHAVNLSARRACVRSMKTCSSCAEARQVGRWMRASVIVRFTARRGCLPSSCSNDEARKTLMDIALAPHDRAFQDDVRRFLDNALTPELRNQAAR